MIRAFVALDLPEPVRVELQFLGFGLGLAAPVPPENLHLTLVFLGEVPEPVLEDAHTGFGRLRAPAFDLTLAGIGMFGGARPRSVHVGVRDAAPLRHLQAKVASAAREAGIALDARRFTPHVTLERLRAQHPDIPRIAAAVAARGGFALPPFRVSDFRLVRSRLRAGGSVYEDLAAYPLR